MHMKVVAFALPGVAALVFAGYGCTSAGAADDESADLRLRVPRKSTLRYDWSIKFTSESRGKELGKDLDLEVKKNVGMNVVLWSVPAKGARRAGETDVLMKFQGLKLLETRKAGKDTKTLLKVGRHNILYKENDKVLIDSASDIGLEQITDYQHNLRNLEKGQLHMTIDEAGRLTRSSGNRSLVESLHGGNANSTFPILAGRKAKLRETWDERFKLTTLGEVQLDEPVSVLTRVRFAEWKKRKSRRLALLEVVSAWETRELSGKDNNGLSVDLTELESLGTGLCTFDPAAGCFIDGSMSYQSKYKIEGAKDGETTRLDVKTKTEFTFSLMPKGPIGPKAPQ
jgi:hypothetical protein